MESKKTILDQLPFFTGTVNYYKNPIVKDVLYTDGVYYIIKSCEASWLLIDILSYINMLRNEEDFLVFKLSVKEKSGELIIDDGNDNILNRKKYEFTDFPLENIEFFFSNNVIMLPSEY